MAVTKKLLTTKNLLLAAAISLAAQEIAHLFAGMECFGRVFDQEAFALL